MIVYNSTGGKLSGSKTTEGNKLTASIQNLIPNTTYSIFVTARTSKGFGGQGTSVLARTRKYPKSGNQLKDTDRQFIKFSRLNYVKTLQKFKYKAGNLNELIKQASSY